MSGFSPLRAIRAKCLECSGGSYAEVTACPVTGCALYSYRSGHRPKTAEGKRRELTPAQAAALQRARNSRLPLAGNNEETRLASQEGSYTPGAETGETAANIAPLTATA